MFKYGEKFRDVENKDSTGFGDYWYMMSPNERKCCQSLFPNVLSNLSDNVNDVILICLPCKDFARTSILSKKWRYNWCRRPELNLDKYHWITKNDFDNFIYFLSRNGIQHPVLHLSYEIQYKLPSSVFTCSQLRHLSLHNCPIHHSSTFKGFSRLIILELCEVIISSELLESLIYHCPLLDQLVLVILENLNTIEINVPTLRTLDFTGYTSSICLKNAPLLIKLSFAGRYMEVEDLEFAKKI
uniref:F-box/LRR-repeat protein 15/At3g58940/PEG3-like LRR domain-containing protein n=1 Tax=Solanum lycopersicum TaxID=4081 RepID=A0A3Q7I0I9_SOLLC